MGPKYHFSVITGQKHCQNDKNHNISSHENKEALSPFGGFHHLLPPVSLPFFLFSGSSIIGVADGHGFSYLACKKEVETAKRLSYSHATIRMGFYDQL